MFTLFLSFEDTTAPPPSTTVFSLSLLGLVLLLALALVLGQMPLFPLEF